MSLTPILTYLQIILSQRRQVTSALEEHLRGKPTWLDELIKATRSNPPTMVAIPPGVRLLCDKCIGESDQWNAKAVAAVPSVPDYDRANWKARLEGFQQQHREFMEEHVAASEDWKSLPLRPLDEEPIRGAIREVKALSGTPIVTPGGGPQERFAVDPTDELKINADEIEAKYKAIASRLRNLQQPFGEGDCAKIWGLWLGFPRLMYQLYNGEHNFASRTGWLTSALSCAYVEAVDCLARLAEFHGIWAVPIRQSGALCNSLNWRNPRISNFLASMTWPDCLGDQYHKLPGHQQRTIDDGQIAFLELTKKLDMPTPANAEPTPMPSNSLSADSTVTPSVADTPGEAPAVVQTEPLPVDLGNAEALLARKAKEHAAIVKAEQDKSDWEHKSRARQEELAQALDGLNAATGLINGKDGEIGAMAVRLIAAAKILLLDGKPLTTEFAWYWANPEYMGEYRPVAQMILAAAEKGDADTVGKCLRRLAASIPGYRAEVWRSMAQLLDAPSMVETSEADGNSETPHALPKSKTPHVRPATQAEIDADFAKFSRSSGTRPVALSSVELVRRAIGDLRLVWKLRERTLTMPEIVADLDQTRDLWRDYIGYPPAIETPTRLAQARDALGKLEQALPMQGPEAEQEGRQTDMRAEPANGMTWQEAASRMERLRTQGEPFTSQSKLAEAFGCSSGTINKAIKKTPSLQPWAKPESATPPKAQSLSGMKRGEYVDVVTDRTPSSAPDPADEAAIREYLEREDLKPEERAFFNSLSRKDQLDFLDDPDKHTRILGRKP